ncbi:MAG TPA: signal peptide peptidase SppA [Thermosulfidibacter takaii]|uniref:Signal peptide peptidase SppA n=1 Tax=Thermosulfidibacter takaii TaxID=412593 RepID=A0A7C0U5C6_9BACT|nr:signal peptide peptidase SppA [Thermosulfidibacter takaii]
MEGRSFWKGLFLFLSLLFLLLAVYYGFQRWRVSLQRSTYVGVVSLEGRITSQKAREFIELLQCAKEDPRVGAVLVRIDSPGGGVAPSQEIYRAIMGVRKEKNVIASLGSVGASGGYYVAAAANEIYADPGTITGSIGVVFTYPQLQEFLKKVGVGKVVVKSGEFKDIASPFRSPTPQEKAILQDVVNDIYQQFMEDIARGRGMKKEQVEALADGRIFTGRQAQKLGLVDGLMTQDEVVSYISSKILRVKGKPRVLLLRRGEDWRDLFRKTKGLLESLIFKTSKISMWEVE